MIYDIDYEMCYIITNWASRYCEPNSWNWHWENSVILNIEFKNSEDELMCRLRFEV